MKRKQDIAAIAGALGVSRVMTLPGGSGHGPLGLLQLRAEVQERLGSSGGRPTDPEWDIRRTVPFRRDRWKQIEKLAAALGGERTTSPAQLAAILVERGLDTTLESLAEPNWTIPVRQAPLDLHATSFRASNVEIVPSSPKNKGTDSC